MYINIFLCAMIAFVVIALINSIIREKRDSSPLT